MVKKALKAAIVCEEVGFVSEWAGVYPLADKYMG